MALRLINRSRKPLLHVPRPFCSSSSPNKNNSPPFPGTPPPPSDDPGDANLFSSALDSIRESIRRIDPQQQSSTPESFFHSLRESIDPGGSILKKMREQSIDPGGSFLKKMREQSIDPGGSFLKKMREQRKADDELWRKLRELRPADAGKDGKERLSLEELQGRLAKIAELEKSYPDPRLEGPFAIARQDIERLYKKQKEQEEEHAKTGDSA